MSVLTATKNGVDLEKLVATVSAIKADPIMDQSRFKATTRWLNGARSRTKIGEKTKRL